MADSLKEQLEENVDVPRNEAAENPEPVPPAPGQLAPVEGHSNHRGMTSRSAKGRHRPRKTARFSEATEA